MKNSELIEILSKENPDAEVHVFNPKPVKWACPNTKEVIKVIFLQESFFEDDPICLSTQIYLTLPKNISK